MYNVAIVGAGPAGIFAALEIMKLKPDWKVVLIEKGQRIETRKCPLRQGSPKCVNGKKCGLLCGWGGAGAFSNGKLTLTPDVGGHLAEYMTRKQAEDAKKLHPNAELLVHPECQPQVAELADYIGSTSGIMNYAVKSDKKEFIIGTENSIAEHLQYQCPDKKFYLLSKSLICENMKSTTLIDVLNCCRGNGGEEIELSPETLTQAVKCIDKMIELGG